MLNFQSFLLKCPFPVLDCEGIECGKLLGKGGNANVYRMDINNEKFAAKVYLNDKIYEEFYDNLKHELDIAYQLKDSKYSVRVCKLGYVRGKKENKKNKILILMEYLTSHGDLYDHIQDVVDWTPSYKINGELLPKPKTNYIYYNKWDNIYWIYGMQEMQKIKITKDIIQSVEELHSLGVIHGDIKTNNMVLHYLPQTQKIKLVDFGMSYFTEKDDLITIDYKCGTLGYRAPEQDNYKMCCLSDIYSVGITIIELWNGDIWNDGDDFKACRKEALKGLRNIEANNRTFGKLLRDCISLQSKRRPTAKRLLKRFNDIFNYDHR